MKTPIPENTSEQIVDLGQGVMFQWVHEGKIAVFNVPEATRAVVEVYLEATTVLIREWPIEKPFLMLCDAGSGKAPFSMYMRERIEKLIRSEAFTRLHGRFALVVEKGLLMQIVRLFMLTMRLPGPQPRLFFDRTKALRWLEEYG